MQPFLQARVGCCEMLARIVHLAALELLKTDLAVQLAFAFMGVRTVRDHIFAVRQVVDGLAGEEGMEGVRDEVPALLDQILGGELVMLDGLPDKRIRWVRGVGSIKCQPLRIDAAAVLFQAE